MATDAQSWLKSGRNYTEGVEILRAAGRPAFLIGMLEKGPDHYNTQKLLKEIEKLQVQPVAAPVFTFFPGAVVATDPATGWIDVAMDFAHPPVAGNSPAPEIPADKSDLQKLLRIKAQIKQLFTEIVHLHGQLGVLPPGPLLQACAMDIILKDFKKRDLWDHVNYFEKHGKWFEAPAAKPEPDIADPGVLEQKIKNLMANRSKAAAKLKKPQTEGKQKFYEAKVDQLTAEIEHLQKSRK